MSHIVEKKGTGKVQLSLHISEDWPEPLLFTANTIKKILRVGTSGLNIIVHA